MEVKSLLPGDKVDIEIVQMKMRSPEVSAYESKFLSSIFDVNDDETVDINIPIVKERYRLLPLNIRYDLTFSTASGTYKAQGTIIEHLKREGFNLLRFKLTSPLEKRQRREYYRLDCNITAIFMGLTEEAAMQETVSDCKEYMKHADVMKVRGIGTLIDISGGGTRFISSNSLKDISYLLISFKLEGDKSTDTIELVGKIIASDRTKNREKFEHRVQFFHKSDRERERLITYIFNEERRIRKKEQGM
ncbi:MAG: PilZ domain-containing protein [Lachnospiraceae bacterium]|nr:PilZ domain-containing protein [Lachnospiraceae bacterium]